MASMMNMENLQFWMGIMIFFGYCSAGVVVIVIWWFDYKKEARRKREFEQRIALMSEQHNAQLQVMLSNHREQMELLRESRDELARQFQCYMAETREMYTNNVSLVRRYDEHLQSFREFANDLKSAYAQNADVLREIMSDVKHNMFCPIIRNSAIGESICMDVLKKKGENLQ